MVLKNPLFRMPVAAFVKRGLVLSARWAQYRS